MATDNKLLNYIVQSGKEQAKQIIDEAQQKREELLRAAAEEAGEAREAIKAETEEKIKGMKNVAQSNASLLSRNAVLKTKRNEIDKTILGISEYLLSLESDEYFALLYRVAKNAAPFEGVLLLNQRDLQRLPADFTEKLAESGVKATVSDTPVPIKAGFILKNGEVEMNCSTEAMLEDQRNEIEDFVNACLFKEN